MAAFTQQEISLIVEALYMVSRFDCRTNTHCFRSAKKLRVNEARTPQEMAQRKKSADQYDELADHFLEKSFLSFQLAERISASNPDKIELDLLPEFFELQLED